MPCVFARMRMAPASDPASNVSRCVFKRNTAALLHLKPRAPR
jgi:hypothetical protein